MNKTVNVSRIKDYCKPGLYEHVRIIFFTACMICMLFICCQAQPKTTAITGNNDMELINSIFDKMEVQGVATNQNLLYGYFFYDADKSKLEKLKNTLVNQSYRFVQIDKKEDDTYMLHVKKESITQGSRFLTGNNN